MFSLMPVCTSLNVRCTTCTCQADSCARSAIESLPSCTKTWRGNSQTSTSQSFLGNGPSPCPNSSWTLGAEAWRSTWSEVETHEANKIFDLFSLAFQSLDQVDLRLQLMCGSYVIWMKNTPCGDLKHHVFLIFNCFRVICFSLIFFSPVCSVRVIGESDIMQEFLSESDEVCIIFTSIIFKWSVVYLLSILEDLFSLFYFTSFPFFYIFTLTVKQMERNVLKFYWLGVCSIIFLRNALDKFAT